MFIVGDYLLYSIVLLNLHGYQHKLQYAKLRTLEIVIALSVCLPVTDLSLKNPFILIDTTVKAGRKAPGELNRLLLF